MKKRFWILTFVLVFLLSAARAEIIHIDPSHGEHEYGGGNVCSVCGWMKPGFYMDGEMVLSWDELKSMGYVEMDEWKPGRLYKVSGNLDGLLVIDEEVTEMDGNMYPLFKDSPLQAVWIPRSVTSLGRYLISGTVIREVRLFCPVTGLDGDAFSETLNKKAHLESVWLPDTLTEIGSDAFKKCTALHRLDLPDTVEKIGSSFLYDNGVTELKIPSCLKDATSAFAYSNLDRLTLPAGVEKIGHFSWCSARYIDLSAAEAVTALPSNCFESCRNLTELKLPPKLESFGNACFYDARSLKRLSLPDGFKSFGNSRLEYVDTIVWPVSLIDVTIPRPDNLQTIYYRGSENQWKLCGANSKWDLSGVSVVCGYTGD